MDINTNKFIRNYYDNHIWQYDEEPGRIIYSYNSMFVVIRGKIDEVSVSIKLYTNSNNTIKFVIMKDYIHPNVYSLQLREYEYSYNIDTNELENYNYEDWSHVELHDKIKEYIKNNRDFIRILMMMKRYVLNK